MGFLIGGTGLKLAIALVLVSVVSGSIIYIQNLKMSLQVAQENQAKLEGVVAAQKAVMEQTNSDIEKMREINKNLSVEMSRARKDVSDLEKKFRDSSGRTRDFAAMAAKEPQKLQDRINRGTLQALRCNEISTGSPLTEDERSGKERNSICPELIKQVSK